jgi:hypothetical protein
MAETLRAGLSSEQLRASYFASVQGYYELYLDILMKMHDRNREKGFNAEALQVTERARARSLLDLLNEAGANIRQGIEPALLDRERELQQLLGAKAPDAQIAQLGSEIEQLTGEFQAVQARIRATSPRYAALTQPRPLSPKEIQEEVLDSDTLLLEYALGEDQSYLWAVTPTSIRSYTLPSRKTINDQARLVYELMTERNRGEEKEPAADQQRRVAKADAQLAPEMAQLSKMLLGPVAAQLGAKRLVIVGQGALQYLPFGALPEPEPSTRRGGDAATRRFESRQSDGQNRESF